MLRSRSWFRLVHQFRTYYAVDSSNVVKDQHSIARDLQQKIKATGPITVADYMRQVLTNPAGGYYMHRDVFGASGDFVTSPELNQMFGEMIAIWLLNEWSKAGSPKPVQIVELGPGRGTLSQDLLRVFEHFDSLQGCSLHLVEISPMLSDLQARRLCLQSDNIVDKNSVIYRQGLSHQGIAVKWYRRLDDVPHSFTLLVAHEFFDALPVHKFQKMAEGYREVLIDIDPSKEFNFRYVIARNETPMSQLLIGPNESRDHLEISPDSMTLCRAIAGRIESDGGLALMADYGHDGDGTDTFRAFRKHQLHDPLIEPGTADLTADVDFSLLRKTALDISGVLSYGPVPQRDFLMRMGIEHRFKTLSSANKAQIDSLQYSYSMMLDEDKMGCRFKFLALMPAALKKILDKYPPAGFH